ncbi:UNVERIFIED_CONTAM: hypothetical protein FKN15_067775 [Acipenser sinensis]
MLRFVSALCRLVQRFIALCSASALGASASALRDSVLDASALGASTPRRLTLRRLDARHFDARRIGASTLCARTSTLDTSAHRRSVHAPRRSSRRRPVHAPRRSMLAARTSTLDASVHRRSVHAPRRFGARRSVHAPRAVVSGFHHCVTCQAKLPASDPHEDCVACLGPEHAASALADRSFCALCANFQRRTLRQRARKAVGSHSPSSGSSYTLSVPPSSTATPPVTLRVSKGPSQLTAGQRSPDRRRAHERSHSPSIQPRGSSPRRERSRRSWSRSVTPA